MKGNANHRLNCLCPFCKQARKETLDSFTANIRDLSKGELAGKIGSIDGEIVKIVRGMALQYKLMMRWQEKKEIIEDRLEEKGFRQ